MLTQSIRNIFLVVAGVFAFAFAPYGIGAEKLDGKAFVGEFVELY